MEELTRELDRIIEARASEAIPLPAKGAGGDVEDGGVPRDMEAGPVDADGWVAWKWLPSRVSEADVAEITELAPTACAPLRAYLRAHCHLFQQSRWNDQQVLLVPIPSDDPLGPFLDQLDAWAPLVDAGYVPFATWGDGWGPICVDVARESEGDAPVIWLDHEILAGLPDSPSRAQLEPHAQPVSASLVQFLRAVLAQAA